MKTNTSFLVALIMGIMIVAATACGTSQYGASNWQDLNHSRDLDELKGKRLKPLQKNVGRSEHY